MIVSDRRKQVFCHIPKNGGSSLRSHFLTNWDDARQYRGRQNVAVLQGAIHDLTHLTPREAQTFFGDDLIGRGYRVTAVVRPPLPRVASALLQYVRSFVGDRHFATAELVERALQERPLPALCDAAARDYRCIFFRRQSDFLEGVPERQRDLVDMADLSVRFPDLGTRNPGGRLPAWAKAFDRPVTRRLSGHLGRAVKDRMIAALVRKDPDVSAAIDTAVDHHMDFLTDFYGVDQLLYDTVRSRDASTSAGARARTGINGSG